MNTNSNREISIAHNISNNTITNINTIIDTKILITSSIITTHNIKRIIALNLR